MTSSLCIDSDEIFSPALDHIIGARVNNTHLVPQTGLVVLSLYLQCRLHFACGVGPITVGVGLLPRSPEGGSDHNIPIVAAMRAHLVGAMIRSIELQDNTLWIIAESSASVSDGQIQHEVFPVRLALEIARRGSVRLFTPSGAVITWPPGLPTISTTSATFPPIPQNFSLEDAGKKLVETSDAFVIESFRRHLLAPVRQKRARLEKRAIAVRQDLARLDAVPQLQKIGSLLLAHGQTITRGTTRVTLIDWDTNENVAIDLAPDKPIQDQAAEFFQKARRLQRGAQFMRQRIEDTTRAIAEIIDLETDIQNVSADLKSLEKTAEHLHALGFLAKPRVSTAKPDRPEERKPYHTFCSTNGQKILVGRSGKDNDELVIRYARPNDLWLHAKNIRGAHVIVPLPKNRSCPADVLVDAATLAAHFSDARNESICEVSYVERRYVRKSKKSPPGAVTTQREKVIAVRIEKNRLARLLSSKFET